MTTFLLIRHAMCDHVGRTIAGRSGDLHLNEEGRSQALALAEQLDSIRIDAIVSSPLPRARETAKPLADRRKMKIAIASDLTEIDYGDWTGEAIDELRGAENWTRFNALRSLQRVPGGEHMLEVQARAISRLESLRCQYPDGCCAVISHGDVIRSLVAHCAGIPLDLFQRLEIATASISVLILTDSWVAVRCVNVTPKGLQGIA